ncbi:hypothetical protein [Pseudarthrobacter scleromae]|uniref:Uncharacterized protein n=1 Tax=Pseudarthrobacter scleromae TaxID=158897 RepID=A0ABQ2CM52_9MICC|nr:hypothetical protein [Pseudarthrobacter scleromae]GGI95806.1 hypothetical protein GCM10007175_36880 [Pseudarthrobacter scleromae]
MIEILQWSTLATCGLIAAARVPSAIRGENRSLFFIFGLMTVAILLSIEAPYVAIDQALGGINLANLLLRFIIFAAIYFVGIRVTRGFGADSAYRLITGKAGMVVLLVISLALMVLFFMMDTVGSSAGLAAVSEKSERNFVLVEYYGAAGRAYPAYISLVLLPAMVRAVRSRLPLLVRVAAALLATGGVAIALTLLFPAVPPEWGAAEFVINYTAVLCFVLGLALIWAARVRSSRTSPAKRTYTEK